MTETINIDERTQLYGDPCETFPLADKLTEVLLNLGGAPIPGERQALQEIVMKLIRHRYSPHIPDHLADVKGYTEILQRLYAKELNLL